ncbi:hypothetical protein KC901_01210 [Patescibacteria group bacterium]|nr:hypothetical protein [Patescibacteria group bacterium]
MEVLGKIFGSPHRVKVMRLFLSHETTPFDIDDIVTRTRSKKADVRKEINMLTNIGLLKKKTFSTKVPKKTKKKNAQPEFRTVKKQGWILNTQFSLVRPLQILLVDSELIDEKDIVKRIKRAGPVKLLILSGLFVRDNNRHVDVLVVGNKLKKDVLYRELSVIESEIGRELTYAFFDQAEFEYRMSMYDKLVRDVLENDHKRLVNKIIT